MFRVFVDSEGEIVKAEHADTGQMYAKVAGDWHKVNGNLEQHMRFHPYDDVTEVETVDDLDVNTLK